MSRHATSALLAAVLLPAAAVWQVRSSLSRRRAEKALSRAQERMRQKDYAGVVAALEPSLADLPSASRFKALCLRAEARAWVKDETAASADLEAAKALNPKAWDAYYGLARLALLEPQRCAEGLKTLEGALKKTDEVYWFKAREMADIHRLKWRCYQSLGNLEASAAELGQELGARAQNGETSGENVRFILANRAWAGYLLYEKLMARLSRGEWETIYRERTGRTAQRAPSKPMAALKAWTESLPYQQLAQAETDVDSALAIRSDTDLRLLRARILVAGGKGPQAAGDLAAASSDGRTSGNPEYWLLKASAEGQRKDFRDALASVERSLALNPKSGEALQLRRMLLKLSRTTPRRAPAR